MIWAFKIFFLSRKLLKKTEFLFISIFYILIDQNNKRREFGHFEERKSQKLDKHFDRYNKRDRNEKESNNNFHQYIQ